MLNYERGEPMTDRELIAKAKREYLRDWRRRNADHVREYQRQWRERNPDKWQAAQDRYWLKKIHETQGSS